MYASSNMHPPYQCQRHAYVICKRHVHAKKITEIDVKQKSFNHRIPCFCSGHINKGACSCFFFWPLSCLSFYELQILIAPLVSSIRFDLTVNRLNIESRKTCLYYKLLKKNEKKKYHTVGTVPKSNRKFVEIEPT